MNNCIEKLKSIKERMVLVPGITLKDSYIETPIGRKGKKLFMINLIFNTENGEVKVIFNTTRGYISCSYTYGFLQTIFKNPYEVLDILNS